MAAMNVYSEAKGLYTSLQEMVGLGRRKRQLQISEPFNFRKEIAVVPGLTEDEISVLREKAAASRLGIAHPDGTDAVTVPTTSLPRPGSRRWLSSLPCHPSPPPRLSIPIPIPNANAYRHAFVRSGGGYSYSSLRSSRTTGGGTGMAQGMGLDRREVAQVPESGGGGPTTMRPSASVNDLDLLLFGNPSGIGKDTTTTAGTGAVSASLLSPPLSAAACSTTASSSISISPLDLTDGSGGSSTGATSLMERSSDLMLEMDFEFELGSPVSPLSPSPAAGMAVGKKGLLGM